MPTSAGQRFASSLLLALTSIQLFPIAGRAQGALIPEELPRPRPRITQRIDEFDVVRLRDHVPRRIKPEYDQGPVAPSFEMRYVTLLLKPSDEQQAALDKLLLEQQDPSAPNYHRWLTPEQFGDRFGLSESDINKIVAWLEGNGLTVEYVATSRTWIAFSGTADRVQNVFRTEIHRYYVQGEDHYANAVAPAIPTALADVAAGIHGLDDFRPEPAYTDGSGGHQLAPGDIATIYKINPLYSMGIDGSGQTIVVVGQSDVNLSDVVDFRNKFGLPGDSLPQKKQFGPDPGFVGGSAGTGNAFQREAALDLEWVGAVARSASIMYVYSTDVFYALLYAIDHPDLLNNPSVISVSFSWCEPVVNDYQVSFLQSLAKQANSKGITWVAGSGDSGAAACDMQGSMWATGGLAVNVFASIPEVTGVGGTGFIGDDNAYPYWNCNNCSNGGTATGPIPETGWNDTNFVVGLAASGGGVSTRYLKPPWQEGLAALGGLSHRGVPDVALTASWTHDPYFYCVQGKCANGGSGATTGGTSAATPVFAGIVALLNQHLGYKSTQSLPGLGNINARLYQLAQDTGSVFRDIKAGSNIVPCSFSALMGGSCFIGYRAGQGYDLVTGLGSVDAYSLVMAWNRTFSVTLAADPSLGPAPLTTTLMASVTGTAASTTYNLWYNCPSVSDVVSEVAATCGSIPTPAPGTCASNSFGQMCNGVTVSFELLTAVYSAAGVYTAKVIAERAGAPPAENHISITVNTSSVAVSSVSFSGSSVTGGSSVNGTVTLNSPAPSGGAAVVLTSQPSGIIQVPPSVVVAPGSTTGIFTAPTSYVAAPTTVVVTASYNSTQATKPLVVNPQSSSVGVAGLSFNPTTVNSGGSAVGTITLTGSAPSGGAYVTLSADTLGVVQIPPPVTIPSGGNTGTFSVGTLPVPSSTNVAITAGYNATAASATITVNPSNSSVVLSNVSFNSGSIVGGSIANGSVSLSGPAPSGGATVTFTSSPTNVLQLPSVTIPAGSSSAPISAATSVVTSSTTVSIAANYNGRSVNATLVLTPLSGSIFLSSLVISPSAVVGGFPVEGVVTLNDNAPSGGAVVSLSSNNDHFAQVPQTVTVTPGYNNRAFLITTSFTSGTTGATITASYNGITYGASLTVLPVAVSGVTFYPSSLTAGDPAAFTVYLTGPAPAGAFVSLTSSDPSVLQVPQTAPLTTGATGVTVSGTTFAVASQTTVSVKVDYNLSSGTGSLTLVPAPPLTVNTFNFSPSTITGGATATGIVWLTGLAPSGGAKVALSSSSGLVQVPSTVTVPAGAAYAPVTATTSSVSTVTNVTVTASYGGVSVSDPLWLVPPLPFLASLSLSPSTVNAGSSITGTVTLTSPAPVGGVSVPLTSSVSYAVAKLPPNPPYVPEGATSATFTVSASPIGFIVPVTISASYNGISKSVPFTIVPPGTPLAPSSLVLSPLTVTSGSTATATVTLTGAAPSGGAVISLSSDNPAVQVAPTVTIPAGASSIPFAASTLSVSAISTATITATYNGISQTSLLTLKPSVLPPASNPVPFLVAPLAPASHTPGGTGFSVTVNGSGFVPGAQILWNGTALPTTLVSPSQLQAPVPATGVQMNGSGAVTVANPGSVVLSSNALFGYLTYPTSAPSFSASSLSVSGSPATVATGDFNRDGILDLAVGKNDSSGLSIFLGNGDGTFGPEHVVTVINSGYTAMTRSLAVGDFNGDGKLDIVLNKSSTSSGLIGVLLGNGDGTFTPAPDISLPASTGSVSALAVGDLNGDGALDLVVTGIDLTQAYVFLGNGDGTFRPPASFGSVNQPSSVAVADFDGDGKLDLALPDYINQAVAILLGNGDGTFRSQKEYPANGYPGVLVVADFNGDGRPDIATNEQGPIGTNGAGVAVLLNKGDGTFFPPVNYAAGQAFYFVATDDLDGDGKVDLLAAKAPYPFQPAIFLGNGDGTFSATPIMLPSNVSTFLAIADLNGDGAPDILAPSNTSGSLPILLQSINSILQVSPSNLSFAAIQASGSPSPLSLAISNTGGGTATWSASASQSWVVLSQTSGTAPSAVTVTADPSGLTAGMYTATITVTATGASNSPQTVQVTLVVSLPSNPVPAITSLSPASVTAAAADFTLTVSGVNFISNSMVNWNGSARPTTFVSSMQLTAAIPAADVATAGTVQVTVTNPAPGGGTSTAVNFTINNPAPSISSLMPATAAVGGGGFTLTLAGSGFVSGSVVRWNGTDRTTTFVSSGQLTAAIAAADNAAAGTAQVTVFNPTPGGGASSALSFTVAAPGAIVKISGDTQSVTVNTQTAPLVVQVNSASGLGLAGVTVNFTVTAGNATLSAGSAVTGANGQAQVTVTMGTVAGPVAVSASVSGIAGAAVFNLTAAPGQPANLTVISGNNQSVAAGAALPAAVVIKVTDQYNNPAPGVTVNFAGAGKGDSFNPASATTGSDGRAQSVWTLGATAGAYTGSVSVAHVSPAVLNATALAVATAQGYVLAQSAQGAPGAAAAISIVLTLDSGVSVDSLAFGLSALPDSAAPALGAALTFTKDASLPDPNLLDSDTTAISVGWMGLSPVISGPTKLLGQVLVTIPPGAVENQTYTLHVTGASGSVGSIDNATAVTLLPGADAKLTVVARKYLVGDVYPTTSAAGDLNGDGNTYDAGEFGDEKLNILDLIIALRAVTGVSRPLACTDRFDAIDSHPVDTPTARGGNGKLDILDLIITLRRVTGVDSNRFYRTPLGASCGQSAAGVQATAVVGGGGVDRANWQERPIGRFEFDTAQLSPDGLVRVPVYLVAARSLKLAGFAFSLSLESEAKLRVRFTGQAGFEPQLIDSGVPGYVSAAWFDGFNASAGDRLLLGFVDFLDAVSADSAPRMVRLKEISSASADQGSDLPSMPSVTSKEAKSR
jgi:subtilase family serine protease